MSVPVTIHATLSELKAGPPGGVKFQQPDPEFGDPWGIMFQCPCGCGNLGWLPVRNPENVTHPSWEWNGDKQRPTLNPSVYNTGMPCKWHGWLRSGEWVQC